MILNGNKFLMSFCMIGFCTTSLFCGNSKMVHDSIQKLDELNKEIVEKSGNIPKNGVIFIGANVIGNSNNSKIDIIDKNIELNGSSKLYEKGDKNVSK